MAFSNLADLENDDRVLSSGKFWVCLSKAKPIVI